MKFRHWGDAKLQEAGYTRDYLNPDMLNLPNATVTGKRLAANGPAYKALIIDREQGPPTDPVKTAMPVAVERKILGYARAGLPIIVSRDLTQAVSVQSIAATMQAALDDWEDLESQLQSLAAELNVGKARKAFAFDARTVAAPLPRAYQWCDGSAFLNHGRLMEKAFNTPPMPDFETIPLMYQGAPMISSARATMHRF